MTDDDKAYAEHQRREAAIHRNTAEAERRAWEAMKRAMWEKSRKLPKPEEKK